MHMLAAHLQISEWPKEFVQAETICSHRGAQVRALIEAHILTN